MPPLPDNQAGRVLAIVAHPDDAEFWAGGTIAHWTRSGVEVTYAILTDGEGGGADPGTPRMEIPVIRRAEQRAAATVLGVTEIRFFGLAEGSLRSASRELHEDLVRIIRQVRPQRVLTWSPEWNWQRVPQLPPRPPRHRRHRPGRHLPRRGQRLRAAPASGRRPGAVDCG